MLCLAVPFVSQLCRIPLGTFSFHRGNCLVCAEGSTRRVLGIAAIPQHPQQLPADFSLSPTALGIPHQVSSCPGGCSRQLWDTRVLLEGVGSAPFSQGWPQCVVVQSLGMNLELKSPKVGMSDQHGQSCATRTVPHVLDMVSPMDTCLVPVENSSRASGADGSGSGKLGGTFLLLVLLLRQSWMKSGHLEVLPPKKGRAKCQGVAALNQDIFCKAFFANLFHS